MSRFLGVRKIFCNPWRSGLHIPKCSEDVCISLAICFYFLNFRQRCRMTPAHCGMEITQQSLTALFVPACEQVYRFLRTCVQRLQFGVDVKHPGCYWRSGRNFRRRQFQLEASVCKACRIDARACSVCSCLAQRSIDLDGLRQLQSN